MSEKIRKQLQRAILESGMSRYFICKKIGLYQSTMSKFMNDKEGLSLEVIEKLAELLDLNIVAEKKGKGQK